MPCWQEQTTTTVLEAADLTLMARAITAAFGVTARQIACQRHGTGTAAGMGLAFEVGDVRIVLNGAEVTARGGVDGRAGARVIDQLRGAYQRTCVEAAAERAGWRVETDARNPQRLLLRRRT